jgi:hypothetical protein
LKQQALNPTKGESTDSKLFNRVSTAIHTNAHNTAVKYNVRENCGEFKQELEPIKQDLLEKFNSVSDVSH